MLFLTARLEEDSQKGCVAQGLRTFFQEHLPGAVTLRPVLNMKALFAVVSSFAHRPFLYIMII